MDEPRPAKNPRRVPEPFLGQPTAIDRPGFVVGLTVRRDESAPPRERRVRAMSDRLVIAGGGIHEIDEDGVYVDPETGAGVFLRRGAQVPTGSEGKPWAKRASGDEYLDTIPPSPPYVGADDVRANEERLVAAEERAGREAGKREDRSSRTARQRATRDRAGADGSEEPDGDDKDGDG